VSKYAGPLSESQDLLFKPAPHEIIPL